MVEGTRKRPKLRFGVRLVLASLVRQKNRRFGSGSAKIPGSSVSYCVLGIDRNFGSVRDLAGFSRFGSGSAKILGSVVS